MRIELQSVSKSYGRTRALDRVSCELEPGQVVAVLGANAAGKSTLLRCLSTVIGPDKGVILCDEQPLRRDRLDLRRRMLFLPDFPLVYGGHSVIRHIGMLLRVYEADTTGAEERAVSLLRDFDLLPLANRAVATLSRGQTYKAALAGLLTLDPEVWLLDEPFASGMDPHGIQAFRWRRIPALVLLIAGLLGGAVGVVFSPGFPATVICLAGIAVASRLFAWGHASAWARGRFDMVGLGSGPG